MSETMIAVVADLSGGIVLTPDITTSLVHRPSPVHILI